MAGLIDAPGTVRLGPFVLQELLGRGGMGEVWRAHHPAQGLEVAVKVLASERARRAESVAAFRSEVRAVAALDHTAIVHVFDHGRVDERAARVSGGRLVAGSPWLAMEMATAGSLVPWAEGRRGPLSWLEERALLVRILDGLAHAHARGLLHLDIKPANVLLCGPRDPRPGIKLTDFGLARPAEAAPGVEFESDGVIAGTPLYMAPEQLESRPREFGPWTDLYSLGCMAFHLAVGAAPFRGDDLLAIAYAHLQGNRRDLVPRVPHPPGFEAWLERLISRDPARRFQRAADAAWTLMHLPEPAEGDPAVITDSIEVLDGQTLEVGLGEPTALITSIGRTQRAPRGEASGAFAPVAVPAGPSDAPPMPPDWRRPERPAPPPRLVGAGLGLFGLRSVPVVGRVADRDLLWSALGQVAAAGQPRWVLLEGPAGCGKSHLARWLCERAEEVGAARVLRAVHNPVPGPGDGLGPMLSRHLRCDGLDSERLLARLRGAFAHCGEQTARALPSLAELMAPGRPPVHRFERPEERFVVVRDLLSLLAVDRPVIVWLDDLQWGLEAATFADWLCGSALARSTPVLLLGTVRAEALAEREAERRLLELARESDRVDVLPLGLLEEEHWPDLVSAVLGLEPRLAHEVATRVRGNPLFAVQLVGDLVDRRLVEPSARGYRLTGGTRLRLPPALGSIWGARVDRVLEGRSEAEAEALELAAVLGQDVDPTEWQAVCARAGGDPSPELLDLLLSARLAVCPPEGPEHGWSFVHGMLREAVEARAAAAGRARIWHRLVAEVLEESAAGSPARLGRHLLEGGACDAAASALLEAAAAARGQADFRRSVALLGLWERAMLELGASDEDGRWFEGMHLRIGLERSLADFPASLRWAARACAAAELRSTPTDLARALVEEARTRVNMGEYDVAQRLLDRAHGLFGGVELCLAGRASAWRVQGLVHLSQGRLDEARDDFGCGVDLFTRLGDVRQAGYCLVAVAQAHKQEGRLGASLATLEEARELFAQVSYRLGLGECANGLGELHRLRGALPEAEQRYAEALELWEAVGSIDVPVVRANLGLVQSARGDFAAARRSFEDARRTFAADGRADLEAALCIIGLPPLAAGGRWGEFERSLERGRALLAETRFIYVDVAREAERAGDLAERRGEATPALGAREVALEQWQGLSRQEDVDRVRAKLHRAL